MWTTVVFVSLLGIGDAEAREYGLDPRVSSISLDDELKIVPKWIDVSRVDYVLLVDVQNNGDQFLLIRSADLRCVRGGYEGAATYGATFGIGERSIDLGPGEIKTLKLLCDHGPGVTGDFALKIAEVSRDSGDGATPGVPVFENVTWRLGEDDITRERQAAGKQLATGSYDRPAIHSAPEPEPEVEPAEQLPPPPAAILTTPEP